MQALIRLANPADIPQLWIHHQRLMRESGRDGDFIFSPTEEITETFENYKKLEGEGLKKSITDLGWKRIWIVAEEDTIYGNLTLVQRPPLKSSFHRALLMMGIQRSHRSLGFGPRLMTEALAWARSQTSLEWIDLKVFAGNEPARKLYRKFEFVENGTVVDCFRVHGESVTDISMTLNLTPSSRSSRTM